MANRKKRLKKGVESLKEQVEIHKEKKRIAEKEGKIELAEYYKKEIINKEKYKKRKERLLKK